MKRNYRVYTFQDVVKMFAQEEVRPNHIPTTTHLFGGYTMIMERKIPVAAIPAQELKQGMTPERYLKNYKLLRSNGASVDEAILLSTLTNGV